MLVDTTKSSKVANRFARPLSLFEWLNWLNQHPSAAIALIVVVNLACHWQTLGGYFLADDFVHVAWLKEVFHGHFDLVLKNFYSTWLQTEGTNFYRPFISVTLVIDRLLFGCSPVGYHISNFLYQCISSMGLYLVARELVFCFENNEDRTPPDTSFFELHQLSGATFLPLLAALFFSVHPLHSEVVAWIIARVDSVCCAFYLLSMWLFLKSRRRDETKKAKSLRLACLFCFVISLLSKEMAVTLPPALVLILMFFPAQEKQKFFARAKNALAATWQLWLILAVYLVFRAIALGSLTGGYQGSIGEGLSASTVQRILSVPSLTRVILPFNAEVFMPLKRVAMPLIICYVVGLLLFVVRFAAAKNRFTIVKVIGFSILWLLLVMIPTIPVWNLTETLQGSRFSYMGTAPLCLLLACLFAPLWSANNEEPMPSRMVAIGGLSSLVSAAAVVIFGFIVFGNNSAWVHAGNELRALRDSLDTNVRRLNESEHLALLNLPHTFKGAHMLYNAATLSVLLAPPLTEYDISSRIATFEPVLFGDDDLIRISRVRKMIQPGSGNHFFYWNRDKEKLEEVRLALGDPPTTLAENGCQSLLPVDIDSRGNLINAAREGTSSMSQKNFGPEHLVGTNTLLLPPAVNVDPASIDFLDICLSARNKPGTAGGGGTVPILLEWNTGVSSFSAPLGLVTAVPLDGKTYRMRIHVSEHKKWLSRGKVHRLGILCPSPDVEVAVHDVAAINGKHSIPQLEPTGKNFVEDNGGVIRAAGKVGHFNYDASSVDGASGVIFEISKPDAWFDHYSNTYRDATACDKALKTWTAPALSAVNQPLEFKQLKGPGFYELRMAAAGRKGEVVGYFSDPIMFQLGH